MINLQILNGFVFQSAYLFYFAFLAVNFYNSQYFLKFAI